MIIKYHKVLGGADRSMLKQHAEALDLTIEHIKANVIDPALRIPCSYVVKKILLDNNKFEIVDIATLINEFLKYHEEKYEPYMKGFAMISDQFDADLSFYNEFIKMHQQ